MDGNWREAPSLDNAGLRVGLAYTKNLYESGYQQVDTRYLRQKLVVVLAPFRFSYDTSNEYAFDDDFGGVLHGHIEGASQGDMGPRSGSSGNFSFSTHILPPSRRPIDNVRVPDLYIPCMALLTYVALVAALGGGLWDDSVSRLEGFKHRSLNVERSEIAQSHYLFLPSKSRPWAASNRVLDSMASATWWAILWPPLEVALVRCLWALWGVPHPPATLGNIDLLATTGYKFIGVCIALFIKLITPQFYLVHLSVTAYMSVASASLTWGFINAQFAKGKWGPRGRHAPAVVALIQAIVVWWFATSTG